VLIKRTSYRKLPYQGVVFVKDLATRSKILEQVAGCFVRYVNSTPPVREECVLPALGDTKATNKVIFVEI
jgi:hypothetical protein